MGDRVGVELLYNAVKTEVKCQLSWVRVPVESSVVRKVISGRRGLWALMSWGPEKMLIRCSKESHHPAEWTPGLRLSIRRTRKTQRDGHKFGVRIFQFCSVSDSLSHANHWVTHFVPLQINWEVNIVKYVFLRASLSFSLHELIYMYISTWISRWQYNSFASKNIQLYLVILWIPCFIIFLYFHSHTHTYIYIYIYMPDTLIPTTKGYFCISYLYTITHRKHKMMVRH